MLPDASGESLSAAARKPWSRFSGMKVPPPTPPEPSRAARHRFITTRWSLVLDACRDAAPQARKALAKLCEPTPEQAFERHWAVRILENALHALGEECERAGKGLLFGKLKQTLTGEAGASLVSIARELGMKTGTVRIHAFRLRRRYRELVEQEVLHTVRNPDEVSDELRFLKSVLQRA